MGERVNDVTSEQLLRAVRNPGADPIPVLLAALDRGDANIQSEAMAFLEEMPSLRAVASLARVLQTSEDDLLRSRAVEVLGTIGGPDTRDVLLAWANDASDLVRLCVAEALGLLRDDAPEITKALCRLMNDEDGSVRNFALEAVGDRGDHAALPCVRNLPRQLPFTRVWVHDTLFRLGDAPFDYADTLRILRRGTNGARVQAAKVLSGVVTPATASRIRRALQAACERETTAGMRDAMQRFLRVVEEQITTLPPQVHSSVGRNV